MKKENLNKKSLQNFTINPIKEDNFIDVKRQLNKKAKTIVNVPKPFLKWAGGKRQLISQMDQYFPKEFTKYIEPFVGGGAIFFYLLPKISILIDINDELINAYKVIKGNISELIKLLNNHNNQREYYYNIRNIDRNYQIFKDWSDIQKASRTIYMNRCCYNGLYRVNSKGHFNVPFGKYKNPKFCDEINLKAVHQALENTCLVKDSFEKCLDFAEKGDFVYFDPPYVPISESANFTGYTKENFGKKDQIKLFEVFKTLDEWGCKVMLSNSYSEYALNLYKNYRIYILRAKRAINSNPNNRGEIKELLITNNY